MIWIKDNEKVELQKSQITCRSVDFEVGQRISLDDAEISLDRSRETDRENGICVCCVFKQGRPIIRNAKHVACWFGTGSALIRTTWTNRWVDCLCYILAWCTCWSICWRTGADWTGGTERWALGWGDGEHGILVDDDNGPRVNGAYPIWDGNGEIECDGCCRYYSLLRSDHAHVVNYEVA